ncbi:Zeaxanthin epoxidase, chloroplastic [Datura stramonium]|uniref:Zeaxanthin epoxidase, chloroplastic n=1 Tax=Datura stramonium TaxID=4076 RepID=A0ABS8VET2_DATST|nr:Zeaxanthin epoxidase, chloroplastic [Datura stramonium]
MEVKGSSDTCLSNQRLLGRVALVTGGASGIGESIVRLFHKHGAKVCVADIQDELGQRVCESLGDEQSACFIHCDVTSEADVSHAVDFAVEKFGTLDIMVNNAGLTGPSYSDIRDYELSVFDNLVDVNLKGVFLGMKHSARIMIPRKKGSIVSLGSIAGAIGGAGSHGYTATKFGVLGLTQNVAAEMGKHGIRVNCVSPYAVPTGLGLAHVPPDQRKDEAIKDFHSYFGKFANLQGVDLVDQDVANAVLFLASDEGRYISGHNLMVDGGFSSVNHSLRMFG